eukprot:1431463-Amphidinium_carterae.1
MPGCNRRPVCALVCCPAGAWNAVPASMGFPFLGRCPLDGPGLDPGVRQGLIVNDTIPPFWQKLLCGNLLSKTKYSTLPMNTHLGQYQFPSNEYVPWRTLFGNGRNGDEQMQKPWGGFWGCSSSAIPIRCFGLESEENVRRRL